MGWEGKGEGEEGRGRVGRKGVMHEREWMEGRGECGG